MSFNVELFIGGVLKGSPQSRKRHLIQAGVIQSDIEQHWGLKHPRQWQVKHLRWFLQKQQSTASAETCYRYWLTTQLLVLRLNRTNDWIPLLSGPWAQRTRPGQS